MSTTPSERLLRIARQAGMLRARDLAAHGIARTYLQIAVRKGRLERVGRGLYALPNARPTPLQSLAEAAKQVPRGVICLLSALRHHGLTTQSPPEVWMAIDVKARKPAGVHPRLRIVRFSGRALAEGVVEERRGTARIRVFCPAKTVADCFKYRNKIGLDVALDALRDCRRGRKASMDELWKYAKVCRVANVMRPYLEALG